MSANQRSPLKSSTTGNQVSPPSKTRPTSPSRPTAHRDGAEACDAPCTLTIPRQFSECEHRGVDPYNTRVPCREPLEPEISFTDSCDGEEYSSEYNQPQSRQSRQKKSPSAPQYPQSQRPSSPQYSQSQSPSAPQYPQSQSPSAPPCLQSKRNCPSQNPQSQSPSSPQYPQSQSQSSPQYPQSQSPSSPQYPQSQCPSSPQYSQSQGPSSPQYPQSQRPTSPQYPQSQYPSSPQYPQSQCPSSPQYSQSQSKSSQPERNYPSQSPQSENNSSPKYPQSKKPSSPQYEQSPVPPLPPCPPAKRGPLLSCTPNHHRLPPSRYDDDCDPYPPCKWKNTTNTMPSDIYEFASAYPCKLDVPAPFSECEHRGVRPESRVPCREPLSPLIASRDPCDHVGERFEICSCGQVIRSMETDAPASSTQMQASSTQMQASTSKRGPVSRSPSGKSSHSMHKSSSRKSSPSKVGSGTRNQPTSNQPMAVTCQTCPSGHLIDTSTSSSPQERPGYATQPKRQSSTRSQTPCPSREISCRTCPSGHLIDPWTSSVSESAPLFPKPRSRPPSRPTTPSCRPREVLCPTCPSDELTDPWTLPASQTSQPRQRPPSRPTTPSSRPREVLCSECPSDEMTDPWTLPASGQPTMITCPSGHHTFPSQQSSSPSDQLQDQTADTPRKKTRKDCRGKTKPRTCGNIHYEKFSAYPLEGNQENPFQAQMEPQVVGQVCTAREPVRYERCECGEVVMAVDDRRAQTQNPEERPEPRQEARPAASTEGKTKKPAEQCSKEPPQRYICRERDPKKEYPCNQHQPMVACSKKASRGYVCCLPDPMELCEKPCSKSNSRSVRSDECSRSPAPHVCYLPKYKLPCPPKPVLSSSSSEEFDECPPINGSRNICIKMRPDPNYECVPYPTDCYLTKQEMQTNRYVDEMRCREGRARKRARSKAKGVDNQPIVMTAMVTPTSLFQERVTKCHDLSVKQEDDGEMKTLLAGLRKDVQTTVDGQGRLVESVAGRLMKQANDFSEIKRLTSAVGSKTPVITETASTSPPPVTVKPTSSPKSDRAIEDSVKLTSCKSERVFEDSVEPTSSPKSDRVTEDAVKPLSKHLPPTESLITRRRSHSGKEKKRSVLPPP